MFGDYPASPASERLFLQSSDTDSLVTSGDILQPCIGKWAVYCDWRCRQGFSPLGTSIQRIADFLMFLWTEKLLSFSAIKGYTTALGLVLCLKDVDLTSSWEISMLLKSFEQSCSPTWDLTLVHSGSYGARVRPIWTAVSVIRQDFDPQGSFPF